MIGAGVALSQGASPPDTVLGFAILVTLGVTPRVAGQSDEDIALGSDLRAVALMNLGTVEASLGLADAERHLQEGAVLARETGGPTLKSGAWRSSGSPPRSARQDGVGG